MKYRCYFLPALICLLASFSVRAGNLNFGQTIYFTAPDTIAIPGTALISSGSTLSGFNFSGAPLTHPLFVSGVYFPVTDCQSHNLWVRVRHVAADPNGTGNGQSIGSTTGGMFQAGDMVLGGWTGFLFRIEIFKDKNFIGTRTDTLGPLYPTTITVASLETLCCPNGPYEWLSFEILNPESTGWNLNTINFTGNNPGSRPGFTDTLAYVSASNNGYRPPQFTPNFPTGKDSVYAITLTTGGYSEFKMTASGVSRFQYGYEFQNWGYQGMSMAFGDPPAVADSTVPALCANWQGSPNGGGSIYLKPAGLGPYTYHWNNDSTNQNLINVAPGTYTATVTDANGCHSQVETYVAPGPGFEVFAYVQFNSALLQYVLRTSLSGGVHPVTYQWNTGATADSIILTSNGDYTVTATDSNGCVATFTKTVTQVVGVQPLLVNDGLVLAPNPNQGETILYIPPADGCAQVILSNLLGQEVYHVFTNTDNRTLELNLKNLPSGIYVLDYRSERLQKQVRLIRE